jgi:hypothetical protein
VAATVVAGRFGSEHPALTPSKGADVSTRDGSDGTDAGERWLRVLAGFGIVGAFAFAALVAHGSRRTEILGWEGAFVIAVLVVLAWNLVPERPRPAARFTRGQLMSATFTVITIVGGGFAPDVVEQRTSTRDWILLPIVLVALFAGYLITERRGDLRVEQELRAWRRMRPQVRPKSR